MVLRCAYRPVDGARRDVGSTRARRLRRDTGADPVDRRPPFRERRLRGPLLARPIRWRGLRSDIAAWRPSARLWPGFLRCDCRGGNDPRGDHDRLGLELGHRADDAVAGRGSRRAAQPAAPAQPRLRGGATATVPRARSRPGQKLDLGRDRPVRDPGRRHRLHAHGPSKPDRDCGRADGQRARLAAQRNPRHGRPADDRPLRRLRPDRTLHPPRRPHRHGLRARRAPTAARRARKSASRWSLRRSGSTPS